VLEAAGDWRHSVFARSALKPIQALPLLETGAAARFGLGDDELAVAVASHNGEPQHVERAASLLRRAGCRPEQLLCGPQPPGDAAARAALIRAGEKPGALHNNCSGKHAGFLALAAHLGQSLGSYLDPEGPAQGLVRRAIAEMCDCAEGGLDLAVDGCSAPTFRLPLYKLALGFARMASPEGLGTPRREACQRIAGAVARWPELIGGQRRRLCTDIARATGGALLPKFGAEAVYAIGRLGGPQGGEGLAVKMDDGDTRGLHVLILALCERFGWLTEGQLSSLQSWRAGPLENWAGLPVGRVEVLPQGFP
jgi:L-asparaginase II